MATRKKKRTLCIICGLSSLSMTHYYGHEMCPTCTEKVKILQRAMETGYLDPQELNLSKVKIMVCVQRINFEETKRAAEAYKVLANKSW